MQQDIFCISALLNDIGDKHQYFNVNNKEGFLAQSRELGGISEIIILEKCNCTELYFYGESDSVSSLVGLWQSFAKDQKRFDEKLLSVYVGKRAIRHLLETACGLKSVTIGDNQVLGQLKAASTLADLNHTVGPVLRTVFSMARTIAKQVRADTKIGVGNASVARGSVELLSSMHLNKDVPILVYGAGQTGSLVLKCLTESGYTDLSVSNRTVSRATELVKKGYANSVVNFEKVLNTFGRFRVVFLATTRAIDPKGVSKITFNPGQRYFDLGNPSNSENFPKEVEVFDINYIHQANGRVLEKRREASKLARNILKGYVPDILNEISKKINQREIAKNNNSIPESIDGNKISLLTTKSHFLFLIRDFLEKNCFIEVQTPYVLAVPSDPVRSDNEELFPVSWYDSHLFLRQSNQLHKQMLILKGFNKIFEMGPFWRAEVNPTKRHLSESIGLDVEFVNASSVEKIIDLVGSILNSVTATLFKEGTIAENQVISKKIPIFQYSEVQKILDDSHIVHGYDEDLGYSIELELSKIIKEKFGHDIFAIVHYPNTIKKFYTKRRPNDLTETFDVIYKGWEISSGAVRETDPALIAKGLEEFGLKPAKYGFYLKSFEQNLTRGHGGFCIGVDRLFARMLNIDDLKEVVLFPRSKENIIP